MCPKFEYYYTKFKLDLSLCKIFQLLTSVGGRWLNAINFLGNTFKYSSHTNFVLIMYAIFFTRFDHTCIPVLFFNNTPIGHIAQLNNSSSILSKFIHMKLLYNILKLTTILNYSKIWEYQKIYIIGIHFWHHISHIMIISSKMHQLTNLINLGSKWKKVILTLLRR